MSDDEKPKITKSTENKRSTFHGSNLPKYSIGKGGKFTNLYEKKTERIGEYVGREFGQEMRVLVLQLKETVYDEPTLADKPSKQDELKWGKEYDLYLKKREKYKENKSKVFATILGSCDESMKNRLKGLQDYEEVDDKANVTALLQMIKEAMYDDNDKKYPAMQAVQAWKQLMRAYQHENEEMLDYYKRFKNHTERVMQVYGEIKPVKLAEKDTNYDKGKAAAIAREKNKMLAYAFMDGATKRYKPLLRALQQDYALGEDKYPRDIEEALQVLTEYASQNGIKAKKFEMDEGPSRSLTFVQKREMIQKGQCFNCGETGHKAYECPKPKKKSSDDDSDNGVNAMQADRPLSWMY